MNFEQKLLVLLEIVSCCTLLVRSLSAENLQNCSNVQTGTIGDSAVVQCNVKQRSNVFYWFNDSSNDHPLIRYNSGNISGLGCESKEYSLKKDGSLVINEVNFIKNRNYSVLFLDGDYEMNATEIILFIPVAPTTPTTSSKNVSMATDIMTTGAPMNDAGLEIWVIIVIIAGALLVILLILACVICVIRKKDKANRQKLASPNA